MLTDLVVGKTTNLTEQSTPVVLSALADNSGALLYLATKFKVNVDATTAGGPITINRNVELTYVRVGRAWLVSAYRVDVTRTDHRRYSTRTERSRPPTTASAPRAPPRDDPPQSTCSASACSWSSCCWPAPASRRAWLAGARVPLVSGATYLRIEKLPPGRSADRIEGAPKRPFFVLLVGNDSRPGVGGARGDALHVLGVNPEASRRPR